MRGVVMSVAVACLLISAWLYYEAFTNQESRRATFSWTKLYSDPPVEKRSRAQLLIEASLGLALALVALFWLLPRGW